EAGDRRRPLGGQFPVVLRDPRASGRRQDGEKQGRQAGDPVPGGERRQGARGRRGKHLDPGLSHRGRGGRPRRPVTKGAPPACSPTRASYWPSNASPPSSTG